MLYALGSELNGAQESANPASWTKGAKQQVFALSGRRQPKTPLLGCWATWVVRKKAVKTFEISPDGKWAVWSAKKKLWLRQCRWKTAGQGTGNRARSGGPAEMVARRQTYRVRQRARHHSLMAIYDFDRRLDPLSGAQRGQRFHAALVA